MPLLTSPIDGKPMKQVNRFGIELDICTTSGGVWLDKGELERLISFVQDEAGAQGAASYAPQQRVNERYHGGYHDDSHHYQRNKYKKKKSFSSNIMDLLDF